MRLKYKMVYRQGDVSLHKIKSLPKDLKQMPNNVLAYGEITGHRHFLNTTEQVLFRDNQGAAFIQLKQDTELIHSGPDLIPVYDIETATRNDKHLSFTVQKGIYKIEYEKEFSPFDEVVSQILD